MRQQTRRVGRIALLVTLAALVVGSTGCGYLRNVRDDLMDCGTFAVGIVPPVVPTEDGPKAVGFLPPAIGAYAEITQFFHLGFLYKATGDLEMDRRGAGTTVDIRRKIGLGPIHDVYIKQHPIWANAYKMPGSEMDGWRQHMRMLRDPVFDAPAKTLIFKPMDRSLGVPGASGWESLPYLYRGWQDWEMISLEIAIPEPFICHKGFYVRAGVDPSQFIDLAMSIFGADLYSDAAYTFWGDLKYP